MPPGYEECNVRKEVRRVNMSVTTTYRNVNADWLHVKSLNPSAKVITALAADWGSPDGLAAPAASPTVVATNAGAV